MKKNKFVLSSDMVNVSPEPQSVFLSSELYKIDAPVLLKEPQEHLSFKVSTRIKKEFQIWCVKNNKTMTEALEECMEEFAKRE